MPSDRDLVELLGPVGPAFFGQFWALREIQRQAIELVLGGSSILLAAATASGKTEALFAPLVARLSIGTNVPPNIIRVLSIAPTRALVNDLYARLDRPLGNVGWSCGRQTSDHGDKTRRPNVLITTPESFDSMLVRDAETKGGKTVGHLLARVEGVVVDEAHLFDGSARGDQVQWLMARLRRLRGFASRHGIAEHDRLQVCAASATVAHPESLARRLLGRDARAVVIPGSRDIEFLSGNREQGWLPVRDTDSAAGLGRRLPRAERPSFLGAVEGVIWRALSSAPLGSCRKLLVFVPTRQLCDRLATHLADTLPRRRQMSVLAHHGSLERPVREHAEGTFGQARDAVLVATTTLEVGVDIGDVDAVVLVGAPPDTNALLQRVGRGGRRIGITRVVPIARDWLDACALGSMLVAARDGVLDCKPHAPRWSVFVQQAASFIAQGGPRGRAREQLLSLAEDVWPGEESRKVAAHVLDGIVSAELLTEFQGRLSLGDEWSDNLSRAGGNLHNNLDTEGPGLPVVDASTGEVIARVQQRADSSKTLVLGGQRWEVVRESGEIVLKPSSSKTEPGMFRYAARAAPVGRSFARHVLLGLGLQEEDAPLLDLPGGPIWLHGGGSAYEAVLARLFPDLARVPGMKGLALKGAPEQRHRQEFASNPSQIGQVVVEMADELSSLLSPGPYHRLLPDEVRQRVVVDLFGVPDFVEWLGSRRVGVLKAVDVAGFPFQGFVPP